MLLQPSHFLYSRKQKNRTLLSFNNTQKILIFGSAGLMILSPMWFTADQLFSYKLFLKRAARKSDRTQRFVWFHAFPHLPLTRKPKGVRMGKGKGKLNCWFTNIPGGTILIEFKNLRKGRSEFFSKQITHKFGLPTKIIYNTNSYFTFPLKNSSKIFFKTSW